MLTGPEVTPFPRLTACTTILPSAPVGRLAGRRLVVRCHQGDSAWAGAGCSAAPAVALSAEAQKRIESRRSELLRRVLEKVRLLEVRRITTSPPWRCSSQLSSSE